MLKSLRHTRRLPSELLFIDPRMDGTMVYQCTLHRVHVGAWQLQVYLFKLASHLVSLKGRLKPVARQVNFYIPFVYILIWTYSTSEIRDPAKPGSHSSQFCNPEGVVDGATLIQLGCEQLFFIHASPASIVTVLFNSLHVLYVIFGKSWRFHDEANVWHFKILLWLYCHKYVTMSRHVNM